MSARILHVSDLHAGIREHPDVEAATAALVERVQPELVVASGDLSHRGRRTQLERAERFLGSLGPPVLAVPGNHDLPHTVPARFLHPWAEFERLWGTVEPTHASASLHVVGLNSARPYRHQGGALRDDQLRRAAARLAAAADGAYRVVVLHHHLLGAPWRAARKRPLARRSEVLHALAAAGADLILGGHIHQAALAERHEFEVVGGEARATVVSVAPGFGQPRPSRLGEARGLHVYEVDDGVMTALTYLWREGDWELRARRTFPRGADPLSS
ncbi:MAG TPA: metallophosphoesterase [Gaiellaceae bacterium]|nr:metallophosphoesterase [Gaiellaceae bacterium]HXY81862.1 metallophosphoesterase [Gaiellaceae bacterium]